MSFSHVYGEYNVEATLNEWFIDNITAAGVPAWMPSARVIFDWGKENPVISGYSGHAFSVTHIGHDPVMTFQGRNTVGGSAGQRMEGEMIVNCWVSRGQAGASHPARLRQMGDMVRTLFTSGREVEIKNWYTGASAPSGIGALVRVGEAARQAVAIDPNPDIVRQRYSVMYQWIERV